jgi:hypothetical protein
MAKEKQERRVPEKRELRVLNKETGKVDTFKVFKRSSELKQLAPKIGKKYKVDYEWIEFHLPQEDHEKTICDWTWEKYTSSHEVRVCKRGTKEEKIVRIPHRHDEMEVIMNWVVPREWKVKKSSIESLYYPPSDWGRGYEWAPK